MPERPLRAGLFFGGRPGSSLLPTKLLDRWTLNILDCLVDALGAALVGPDEYPEPSRWGRGAIPSPW